METGNGTFGGSSTGGLSRAELARSREQAIDRVRSGHPSPAQVPGRPADGEPRRTGWDKQARRRRSLPRPGEGTTSLTRGDLLSVSEAAALLGVNPRTLYRLIDRQQVPGARRLGRTVVVVRPILEHWLLTGDDGYAT